MSKSSDLPDFQFYEEIGFSQSDEGYEQTKRETAYERNSGLDQDQLAKLQDDMLSPLREPSDYDEKI